MKKLLTVSVLAAVTLGLTGCGWFDRKIVANLTGYTTLCVKETNVQYVQGPSGLAPLVDVNGKPVACK